MCSPARAASLLPDAAHTSSLGVGGNAAHQPYAPRVYIALRDADKADADLRRVLQLEPGNGDARHMAATELRALQALDHVSQAALAKKMFATSLG